MSNPADDLEAVRTITKALESFDTETRERVIRWAREKLGLPSSIQTQTTPPTKPIGKGVSAQPQPHQTRHTTPDLKTFAAEKKPKRDTHFAATVAYYYKFEAPEAERKDYISGEDLQEACRKAGRSRLKNPRTTLSNAHRDGLLDRTGERGKFTINTVGENLVAMTLPGDSTKRPTSQRRALKKTTEKAVPKKAKRQKSTKRK